MDVKSTTYEISADTSAFRREIAEADRLAQGFGRSLSSAFQGAVVQGKGLDEVMSGLALRLSRLAVDAAFKPIEQGLTGLFQNLSGSLTSAIGGALTGSPVTAFAQGGVIATPSFFPLSGGRMGVAGEAGPEAILPLARGADGRLGVRSGGGGGGAQVVVNISTPDAASFRRSQAWMSRMLADAVERGSR